MTQHVQAIYEAGVLKPLTPLNLIEREVVSLSIAKLPTNGDDAALEPTLFELLNDAGLIGCLKNAPADLSANPQHLEGFGSRAS